MKIEQESQRAQDYQALLKLSHWKRVMQDRRVRFREVNECIAAIEWAKMQGYLLKELFIWSQHRYGITSDPLTVT